ncbi:MAG TPA: HEAT repeat domain-containing protein [Gemmatimonadaceae bacterium]|nr:HEAT repeat domain-containing protein [Gemmatimonadaceae bacterium]
MTRPIDRYPPSARRHRQTALAALLVALFSISIPASACAQQRDSVATPAAPLGERISATIRGESGAFGDAFELVGAAADSGIDVLAILTPFFRDPSPPVRASVVSALDLEALTRAGTSVVDSAIALLHGIAHDPDVRVRRNAVAVLAYAEAVHPGSSLSAVVGMLDDPDPGVRETAIDVLAAYPSNPTVLAEVPRVARLAHADPSEQVRSATFRYFESLGPAARTAIPELVAIADTADMYVRPEVLRTIAAMVRPAPGKPPHSLGVAALAAALSDADPDVRAVAAAGIAPLAQWGAEHAAAALSDSSGVVVTAAARALAYVAPDPVVIAALARRLGDRDRLVREAVSNALASLGESGRQRLHLAAQSTDAATRNAARRSLRLLDLVRSAAVAGRCYRIDVGPWLPGKSPDVDSTFRRLPDVVKLDTRVASDLYNWRDDVRFRAVSLHASAPLAWSDEGSWIPVAGTDSVQLVWSTGYVGIGARLRMRDAGAGLEGDARTFSDVIGQERQRARIIAIAVPCPVAAE